MSMTCFIDRLRYAYAGNNPLTNVDPSGFSFLKNLMKLVGVLMEFVSVGNFWARLAWRFVSGFLASGGTLEGGLIAVLAPFLRVTFVFGDNASGKALRWVGSNAIFRARGANADGDSGEGAGERLFNIVLRAVQAGTADDDDKSGDRGARSTTTGNGATVGWWDAVSRMLFPAVKSLGERGVEGNMSDRAIGAGKETYNSIALLVNMTNPVMGHLAPLPQMPIADNQLEGAAFVEAGITVVTLGGTFLRRTAARSADPRKLIPRQGPSEMSGSKVKRLKRDMQQRGFDPSKPIDIADVDGRQIILDGHHRARAAAQAGLRDVPVRVNPVTREQADQLLREAAEASLRR